MVRDLRCTELTRQLQHMFALMKGRTPTRALPFASQQYTRGGGCALHQRGHLPSKSRKAA